MSLARPARAAGARCADGSMRFLRSVALAGLVLALHGVAVRSLSLGGPKLSGKGKAALPAGRAASRREAAAALLSAAVLLPASAQARTKGAAEMDLEYYWKALTKGGKADYEGYVPFPAPAALDELLANTLLRVVDRAAEASFGSFSASYQLEVSRELERLQSDVRKRSRLQDDFAWDAVKNEYVFDAQLLARYVVLGQLLPVLNDRAVFTNRVALDVLSVYLASKDASLDFVDANAEGAMAAFQRLQALLDRMVEGGVISSFKFESPGKQTVAQLAEDWDDGLPISLQVSVKRPVTVTSTAALAARNQRFHPDVVAGPMLKYLEQCGFRLMAEEYVMDSQYRPNVNAYRPDEVLVEFNIKERRPPPPDGAAAAEGDLRS